MIICSLLLVQNRMSPNRTQIYYTVLCTTFAGCMMSSPISPRISAFFSFSFFLLAEDDATN
jgi:hypothetical protein